MLKKYLSEQEETRWHQLVGKARRITILGHASPDGDAMGATLGLCHYLRSAGKEANVVVPNYFPDFLAWMPGASDVVIAERNRIRGPRLVREADLVFCVDFADVHRLEDLSPALENYHKGIIVIDHHLNPQMQGDILVSDPKASSASELVFTLLWQLGAFEKMTVETAQCIYCGMMTDTGAFTYNSSRSEVYYIISQLISKGIDKDKIYRAVYNNYSVERLRLEGYILKDKMVYFPEEHASVYTLTREEMKAYKFKKGDAEGFVNLPLQIKGTKLSISLREDTEKPLVRVSLRSVDDFPCNKMAAEFFNGGGHLNASGGSLRMTMDEAMAQTRKAIEAYRPLLCDNVIKQ
jgi:phosphoesterase RecJ-like protein